MSVLRQNKLINGWPLFLLISGAVSGLVLLECLSVDLAEPAGLSAMIGYSVRLAVPLVYVVIAASAVHTLVGNEFTRWWLRNRKYLGLCFAVAMSWQALFIAQISLFHRDYYFEQIFYLRDEIEGSTGYIFLAAMVVTSFEVGRRHLTARQWNLLHTWSICFLWAYPFSVYWWNLSYYPDPEWFDYLFYWAGFLAFAVRILAWGKVRRRTSTSSQRAVMRSAGGAIVLVAVLLAASGRTWQDAVSTTLTAPEWSANLELWLPFWPFEPFLPLALLAVGVLVYTSSGRRLTATVQAG